MKAITKILAGAAAVAAFAAAAPAAAQNYPGYRTPYGYGYAGLVMDDPGTPGGARTGDLGPRSGPR